MIYSHTFVQLLNMYLENLHDPVIGIWISVKQLVMIFVRSCHEMDILIVLLRDHSCQY